MQVARISMGEYKSVDALDQFIEDYSKGFWKLFPNAQVHQQFVPGQLLL